MNLFNMTTHQLAEIIGWTLIHSVWQISLIALLLFAALRILKDVSANLRYVLSVTALMFTLVACGTTFLFNLPAQQIPNKSLSTQISDAASNRAINQINSQSPSATNSPDFVSAESINITPRLHNEESLQNSATRLVNQILPYLIWVWLFGMMLFSLRFCGGMWQINRFKKLKTKSFDAEWETKFAELCEQTGVRRAVRLLRSEMITTPMMIGWIKPLVIVPSSALLGLNPRELETIMTHELIHIRRHDYLINILQSLVEIGLFFHPLVWWMSAQIRREREHACDDEVVKIFSGEPLLYAGALANLEDFRLAGIKLSPSNIVAASGGNLLIRIQRIIKRNTKPAHREKAFRPILPLFLFIATFLSGVFLAGWQLAGEENVAVRNQSTRTIAVGLYSGPVVLPSVNSAAEDEEIMRAVIAKLKLRNIPVTGFLKGISAGLQAKNIPAEQEKIVSLWREAGFELGALDLKHPQSFDLTIDEYRNALQDRENRLTPLMKRQLDYYKKSQRSKPKKSSAKDLSNRIQISKEWMAEFERAVEDWRREHNFTSIKYTIGSDDWMYSYIYDVAYSNNDLRQMNAVKTRYIDYISKLLNHYESFAHQISDRDITQTLPLTPSRLLADSAVELFSMIEQRGYRFVSIDEAMQDDIYQGDMIYANQVGSSWLQTVALKRRMTLLNEPDVDAETTRIWEEMQPLNLKVVDTVEIKSNP